MYWDMWTNESVSCFTWILKQLIKQPIIEAFFYEMGTRKLHIQKFTSLLSKIENGNWTWASMKQMYCQKRLILANHFWITLENTSHIKIDFNVAQYVTGIVDGSWDIQNIIDDVQNLLWSQ